MFDILGDTVCTIIDKKMAIGNYTIRWDTEGGTKEGKALPLESGIYFIKLNAISTSNLMKFDAMTDVMMIR